MLLLDQIALTALALLVKEVAEVLQNVLGELFLTC